MNKNIYFVREKAGILFAFNLQIWCIHSFLAVAMAVCVLCIRCTKVEEDARKLMEIMHIFL